MLTGLRFYIENWVELLPLTLVTSVTVVFITHRLTKKRKIDELLLSNRLEVYKKFILEHGGVFSAKTFAEADLFYDSAEKLHLADQDGLEWRVFRSKFNTQGVRFDIEVAKVFAECRLVAGRLLEEKLREYYSYISESDISQNSKTIKYLLGLEIEILMRYDIGVISYYEVLVWRLFLFRKRYYLK